LRALAQALRSEGATGRAATNDALLFRAARGIERPGADVHEAALEIQEGLAEFTGTIVALKATGESIQRVARSVEDFEDRAAFSRSFAYATGPALGLLLDRYASNWRSELKNDRNVADLLAKAVHFERGSDPVATARERAKAYGFAAIAEDERAREKRRQTQIATFRARFIDGSTLQFPRASELHRTFNPNNLVPLGDAGTVYPTATFTAGWGRLQVDDIGALLAPDNQSLRVSAPADPAARPLTGPAWRLELAPSWTIRPLLKAGSFEVVPGSR